MKVSISSRIRRSLFGISLLICCIFSGFLFLFSYILEDNILLSQLNLFKQQVEISSTPFSEFSENSNVRIYGSFEALKNSIPFDIKYSMLKNGSHYEYFDNDSAFFISEGFLPKTEKEYFIVYNVLDLLAVRGATVGLFTAIISISIMVFAIAILISHWLSVATLAPVKKLTQTLGKDEFNQGTIDLSREFNDDEIGVLARSLADALTRSREVAQREFEFNQGVSHELRSPIQVVSSTTELLELNIDSSQKKYIARLRRAINEMNETVEAFLWLTSQRSVLSVGKCCVVDILKRIEELSSVRANCNISIQTNLESNYFYHIPQNVIFLIIRNLINNAIAHGDTDDIFVELSEKYLHISNTASDPEINQNGFGLGVAIVERICKRFNMQLDIKNDKPNLFSVKVNF